MTAPRSPQSPPSWRRGNVTAVTPGPPPTVTVSILGVDLAVPYLDSYARPAVGDYVDVAIVDNAPQVIGRAAGTAATWPQSGSGTSTVAAGSSFGTGTAVAFPVAYAAPPIVQVTHDSSVGGIAGNFGVRITARSSTGFTVVPFRADGSVAGAGGNVVGFTWTAVP